MPLGEEIERYRVSVQEAGGRTLALEAATPAVTVSAAAQIDAFGALPSQLTVGVAQLSLGFGAGTERLAVFGRPA